MDSLKLLDFSSFIIFSDDPWSLLVSFCQLFKLPLVVQCCNVICEWPLSRHKSNWCLLSMVFDCWIVSAILSLNQSGYGFPKPSWTQEPSSNGIVLMAVLQYGGQTAVVQRYFVNSHILHTFNIQWVEFNIVNT